MMWWEEAVEKHFDGPCIGYALSGIWREAAIHCDENFPSSFRRVIDKHLHQIKRRITMNILHDKSSVKKFQRK